MTWEIIRFDDTFISDLLARCIQIAVIIGFLILSLFLLFLITVLIFRLLPILDRIDKKNKPLSPDFITPPNHTQFLAKKLFDDMGQLIDGSIAYLEPNGGGPLEVHTHEHNHLFIVIDGEAKVLLGEKEVIVKKDESFLVEGHIPHAVWNNTNFTTVMVGLSVK